MNYEQLIAETFAGPEAQFRAALEADDPAAVALVAILDPSTEASTAVARFETFVSHYGAVSMATELVLGIIEHQETVGEQLAKAAETVAARRDDSLPVDEKQAGRIQALVQDREVEDRCRSRLLLWLHRRRSSAARKMAQLVLSDPGEPYDLVSRMAIQIMGLHLDQQARTLLEKYAERHLDEGAAEPNEPAPNPDAVLLILNSISKPTDADLQMIGRLLEDASEHELTIADGLKDLLGRLTLEQIASLIAGLKREGHADWVAQQFVPALITERAAEIAPTISAEWWPEECLLVFAQTEWEAHDDRLYPIVLEQLHVTGNETACASIRQRVCERCKQTSSVAARDMPRIGARALLKLCLRGTIETTDTNLLDALRVLNAETFAEEMAAAKWKSPERARRVGHIVAQANASLLSDVVAQALEQAEETAVAVMDGATAELLEPHAHDVLDVVADNEAALTRLCELSETAAAEMFASWDEDHDMVAFRALGLTTYAEKRLSTIPAVVRSYGELTPGERAELLDALGLDEERVEVLDGILKDRLGPPASRASSADCISALERLGEHLAAGIDPNRVLECVTPMCIGVREPAIRKAAYAALGNASPTPQVVDLLLARRTDEAVSVRPVVKAALDRIADRLDELAAGSHGAERADAVAQLARIDGKRALEHARTLLETDDVGVRIAMSVIIGACGSQEDADRLEAAIDDEPHPDVRSAFQRAIRKLRIGDSAAAHERIGELVGFEKTEAWVALDPDRVYGEWVNPLVMGLDRVARAESTGEFGTAIDQLDEIAKALLFRTVDIAGDELALSQGNRAKVATNSVDYGTVLGWQQVNQRWTWVHNFGALHGHRTEHIASRGTIGVPPDRDAEDLATAYSLFRLGARECCDLLLKAVASPESEKGATQ